MPTEPDYTTDMPAVPQGGSYGDAEVQSRQADLNRVPIEIPGGMEDRDSDD